MSLLVNQSGGEGVPTPTGERGTGSSSGVGGWLLVVVVVLAILWPLASGAHMAWVFEQVESPDLDLEVTREAAWAWCRAATWLILVAVSTWRIAAGVRLVIDRTAAAVEFAKLTLLGSAFLEPILVSLVFLVLVRDLEAVSTVWLLAPNGILGAGLGVAYLNRSERVRNTYFPNGTAGSAPVFARAAPRHGARYRLTCLGIGLAAAWASGVGMWCYWFGTVGIAIPEQILTLVWAALVFPGLVGALLGYVVGAIRSSWSARSNR